MCYLEQAKLADEMELFMGGTQRYRVYDLLKPTIPLYQKIDPTKSIQEHIRYADEIREPVEYNFPTIEEGEMEQQQNTITKI